MENFNYQNHKLAYLKQGSGEPMLFLHNGGCDHHIWSHQIQFFSQKYTVYAIDWLGFGQSDRPEIDCSLSLYADILKTFIEALKLDGVIIIANCIGSAAALQYARQADSRTCKIVLMNILTEQTLMHGRYGLHYRLYKTFPTFSRMLVKQLNKLTLPYIGRARSLRALYGKHKEADEAFVQHFHRLYTHPEQVRMVNNLLFNTVSFDVLDKLDHFENLPPLLILWGKSNKVLPVRDGEALCKKLKPTKLVNLEDCGHFLMREQPERVNQLISEFISG